MGKKRINILCRIELTERRCTEVLYHCRSRRQGPPMRLGAVHHEEARGEQNASLGVDLHQREGHQLWQLTLNSILHPAIFITIRESFLGIDPHWGLWKKIFFFKRHCRNNDPYIVGGVGFVIRKEAKYFNFSMRESVQGWRQKWFYLRDQQAPNHRFNLPKFSDVLEAKPKKS
ncbi:hypothetical protein QYE76_018838 [Lolium multiflorum]|uniref:Transposase (putative) gypsy type domain-containing protein n=1 Tax=Lolium multiflorum TaxID=4521 RepID=A0AAD8QEX5_LOLMU|nr:hypothetical protein QYE76_018838 [Lolium multiflorum]